MYEEIDGKYIKHLDFALLDILMLQLALILSYTIKYKVVDVYKQEVYLKISILSIVVNIIMIIFNQSYKNILKRGYVVELGASIVHMCCCSVLTVAGMFLMHIEDTISIIMILIFWAVGIITLYVGRVILKYIVRKWVVPNKVKRYIAILTTKGEAINIINKINRNKYSSYQINKVFILGDEPVEEKIMGINVSNYDEGILEEYLKEEVIDEIFINLPNYSDIPTEIMMACHKMGIILHMRLMCMNYPSECEVFEMFQGYPVLTSSIKVAKPHEVLIKRSIDVIGGFIGVVLTGILALILGPMIYLKDPGPIFFSQIRVGRNGRQFKLYKFRSMYLDAEERKKELMEQNEMEGLMFKMTKDPRILPIVGNKIRDWSLDEFPQFLNVLKGEMSLVGTRPPTLDEWQQYDYHHCKRLAAKPGLTGMWQVSGRNDIASFEKIVELDTKYIREWSIMLDIKILIKTVLVVFARSGAR